MKYLNTKVSSIYNAMYVFAIKIYLLFCYFVIKRKIPLSKEKADVIVSLTSYHKRFKSLKWTLESLMQQKTQYQYRLILILSQEDIKKYGKLPGYLSNFQKRGLELLIVEENLKSYKKAFYTYEMGAPLVTADDDIYYPLYWLQKIMEESVKTPNIILAYRGHYILNENNKILPYVEWMKWSEKNFYKEERYSFLPTGTSGVYYPIDSLKGLKESKENFLHICPHADDFWFKYLTVCNAFKARRISEKNIHFPIMNKGESLFEVNVGEGLNDIQFEKIFLKDLAFFRKIIEE
ncbi:hypothetical protein HYG93_09455 [Acinetobacter sp. SwsAc6]|uniref:hypothetical protein n=1 Tax=Acinetobacter sp. SwsAc6 TaxID=2749439 RepID=UPI0015BC0B52|nr:hypothetical protein [Acinetobacter sp. SwsAc6]NWK74512.1 hypothetical protein [Acinetobacter sp. SwsAc6]